MSFASELGIHGEESSRATGGKSRRLVDLMDGDGSGYNASERPVGESARLDSAEEEYPRRAAASEGIGLPRRGNFSTSTGYAILSVTPAGEGEAVAVVLALPASEEEDEAAGRSASKCKRVKLHLLVEQYADLQADGRALCAGEITPERAEELIHAGRLCSAIRKGLGRLQYGDCSARRLSAGLVAKGIDREVAAEAAAYLIRKGYIHEDDTARQRAVQSLRKGWGPRRIRDDLRAQGFPSEAVEAVMDGLSEEDFSSHCADVIRKKYREIPEERGARQKMTAALMRLGYDMEHIREAVAICRGREE